VRSGATRVELWFSEVDAGGHVTCFDSKDSRNYRFLVAASASELTCGTFKGRFVDEQGRFHRIVEKYEKNGAPVFKVGMVFGNVLVPGTTGDEGFEAALRINSREDTVDGFVFGAGPSGSIRWGGYCKERPPLLESLDEPRDRTDTIAPDLFAFALDGNRTNAWDVSLTTEVLGKSSGNPEGHVPPPPANQVHARFEELDLTQVHFTP
jgi:hypothetical protein